MYKESIDIGNKYRQEYRQGVENLVRKMVTKSKENRERIIDGIVTVGTLVTVGTYIICQLFID